MLTTRLDILVHLFCKQEDHGYIILLPWVQVFEHFRRHLHFYKHRLHRVDNWNLRLYIAILWQVLCLFIYFYLFLFLFFFRSITHFIQLHILKPNGYVLFLAVELISQHQKSASNVSIPCLKLFAYVFTDSTDLPWKDI